MLYATRHYVAAIYYAALSIEHCITRALLRFSLHEGHFTSFPPLIGGHVIFIHFLYGNGGY